jgi:sortase A
VSTVNVRATSTIKLILRCAQRLMLALGTLLIGFYAGTSFHAALTSYLAKTKFDHSSSSLDVAQNQRVSPAAREKIDFSLWSEKRVAAYEESLLRNIDPPIGLIRIRRLGLEAPVLEGTNDLTLDRGVGHITGTALSGEGGNIGLAGHRDGFFRVLKDVTPGDEIELLTTGMKETYYVDEIVVVSPKDVSVLGSTSSRSLTLVTCYPFYFIGSAPKRYIVKALLAKSEVLPPANGNAHEIAVSKQSMRD